MVWRPLARPTDAFFSQMLRSGDLEAAETGKGGRETSTEVVTAEAFALANWRRPTLASRRKKELQLATITA